MNLRLSARAAIGVLAFALASVVLLGYMLIRLGAIPSPTANVLTVHAAVRDAEGLPTHADVLDRGVEVGQVSGVSARGAQTQLTLALGSGRPVLHPDASVQIGFKTALGEPFVELDPGRAPGPALRTGAMLRGVPTVALDNALGFLDGPGRTNLRSALLDLGQGAASPATSAEVSDTVLGLQNATTSLGRLATELRSQTADISGVVSNGASVLDVLAQRAAEVRGLIISANQTLAALAGQRSALGGVLTRLPGLLHRARATLASAAPLIREATPVVGQLEAAAPAVTEALRAAPAVTASLDRVLAQAGAIRQAAGPALAALSGLAAPAGQALTRLGPALADLVPVAQYLAPRANTIAAWFANTADLGSSGDANGKWARFFITLDPSTALGLGSGAPPGNSYTAPNDAAHNAPFRAGDYPRLEPYTPALSSTVK
jgi:phospholipid/cholesterol/gamma-HCH transport system substrate-binding protein